ncbi:hypothetical protein SIID45300_00571 [Candidatus Magnetaquicoccaceae bacterium FCR-1]|uniref:Dinitrogenase iron-molybdenum cofactor biosynthesis domain-containing protein n=1 Tax=Candidatus Magnetaquiglobus chichijimensis TaxID=3141448 RepID=A0ABQ0C5V2_9PROT
MIPSRLPAEEFDWRLRQAALELAPLSVEALLGHLKALCQDRPEDPERLSKVTPCLLRPLLQETLPGINGKKVKGALRWLTGEAASGAAMTELADEARDDLDDQPIEIAAQPPAGVVRVAIADTLDGGAEGHFASCSRFTIHDVAPGSTRRLTSRVVPVPGEGGDKVAGRLEQIRDCRILVVNAIGGPAAARVSRAGVLPIRVANGITPEQWLEQLRQVLLGNPPPWLRRCLLPAEAARGAWG